MEKFSLHSYLSLLNTEGSWWVSGSESLYQLVNVLINAGLVLNQWIYQVVDLSLQIFMNHGMFADMTRTIFGVTTKLYETLFSTLGTIVFVLALGIIFILYAFKSPQESLRKMFVLFLVIGVNSAIYVNGEEYLTEVATIFDQTEDVLIQAVNLPFLESDGSQTELKMGAADTMKRIREAYFKRVIPQSFAMVNFGTVVYEDRFDEFLYTEAQAHDPHAKKQLKERVEEESKSNRYMTPDGALDKWFISIYVWMGNVFTGLPLVLMTGLSFLLRILVLCLILCLPPLSILSLIPNFSSVLFRLLGKVLLLLFTGTFATLGMYLFYFMMLLSDQSIVALAGGSSLASCVLGLLAKGALLMIALKKRFGFLNVISGRRITYLEAETVGTKLKTLSIEREQEQALFSGDDRHKKVLEEVGRMNVTPSYIDMSTGMSSQSVESVGGDYTQVPLLSNKKIDHTPVEDRAVIYEQNEKGEIHTLLPHSAEAAAMNTDMQPSEIKEHSPWGTTESGAQRLPVPPLVEELVSANGETTIVGEEDTDWGEWVEDSTLESALIQEPIEAVSENQVASVERLRIFYRELAELRKQ